MSTPTAALGRTGAAPAAGPPVGGTGDDAPPPALGPPSAPVNRSRRRREAGLAYLLLLPALAAFAVFVFYPFFNNFRLALYESPPVAGLPPHYVGLHQVGQVLGSNQYQFWPSLLTTVVFVVMVVPASLIAGLALAVVANRKLRGIGVYRMIFSSTVVSSVAVAALIFGTLMNPIVGLLPWLGINPSPPLLESTTWALPSVAVMTIWQFLGLSFIIMSAGLQSLPEEVLEASRIDGATAWTRFWRVTVPMLSPTIFFGVVVGTIYAFQSFGQIDILIGYANNPAHLHVNVLIYNIVNQLLEEQNTGVAAIMSIALFLVTLLLTLLQLRFLERRVTYAR